MSHLHFCEVTGHQWTCKGTALRPLAGDTEPSICMCDSCHVPMEEGDHIGCMVELLACPEHMDEQLRAMRENRFDLAGQVWECAADSPCLGCGLPLNTHDYTQCLNIPGSKNYRKCNAADPITLATEVPDEPLSPAPHCECGCADADSDNVVGWCMWCDHVYIDYNRMTEDQHFARYCPDAPHELKDIAAARLAG